MESHRFHKFNPANAARLLAAERAEIHPPDEVLALLALRSGHIAADVGCGPGYYTLPIARAVAPEGGGD